MSREFKDAPHAIPPDDTTNRKTDFYTRTFTGSVTVESEKVFEDILLLRIRNQGENYMMHT